MEKRNLVIVQGILVIIQFYILFGILVFDYQTGQNYYELEILVLIVLITAIFLPVICYMGYIVFKGGE